MKRSFGISPLLLIILCCVILIGGLVYTYFYLVSPFNQQISIVKNQVLETQQQLLIDQSQTKQANQLDKDHLLLKVPTDENMDQYLMILENKAADSTCKLLSIYPSNGAKASATTPSTTSASGNGTSVQSTSTGTTASGLKSSTYDLTGIANSFSDLRTFLGALETMDRITYVKAVHFTSSGNTDIPFTLTITIFYDPTLKALGHSKLDLPYVKPAQKNNPF